jgi:mandelate racemase
MNAASLTLTRIRARAVLVPLRRAIIAGIGRFDDWPLVLIDIETDGGATGTSYLAPYRRKAVPAIIAELHDIGDLWKNQLLAPFDAFEAGMKATNAVGVSGISAIAIAGLDMAIWDARAKAAELPLAVFLGGTLGKVRAYNSNGLWRHSVDTLSEEAATLLGEGGFSALKLRLGNSNLRDDLAAIRAVRDVIGPDVDLMVDFNQALGLGDAIRRCHDLDDQGLYWIEEPIIYNNVRGYAQLAQTMRTPLQVGENFYGARDLFQFLSAGAVHYAMADLMRIGGVTGWLRTAAVAGAAGVQLSNHLYPEISAHLLRVTETAHWLEWVDWASPILAEPLEPSEGAITARDRPGAGISWDEKSVSKYTIGI